jgi:hypothetical protein
MATTALRRIQLGAEATAGTPVAADIVWRGTGMLKDNREKVAVTEQVGYATRTMRHYEPKLEAEIVLDSVGATYEQVILLFEAGISIETPTQDGAGGTGYVYEYVAPIAALNTLRYFTVEGGNDELVQEAEYAFVSEFKIAGKGAEAVTMEANLIARQTTDAAFTALTPSDAEVITCPGVFTVDDTGGTMGATAKTGSLLSFELNVTTGWKPKYFVDAKYFTLPYYDGSAFEATLNLVIEHDSFADTVRDKWEAGTAIMVEIQFEGTALATPDTYSNKTFRIQAVGYIEKIELADADGNDTNEITLKCCYSVDDTQTLELLVVNELATHDA